MKMGVSKSCLMNGTYIIEHSNRIFVRLEHQSHTVCGPKLQKSVSVRPQNSKVGELDLTISKIVEAN